MNNDDADAAMRMAVSGKARLVLTETQYKYFDLWWNERWTTEQIAVRFDRTQKAVHNTLEKAKLRVKRNYGKG